MLNAAELPDILKQQKVRRSTAVVDYLREMIVSGQLKLGDKLPTEEKLCQHFGVSRTTLREAIQSLRVAGVLEVTPGRGSFVCAPDIDHMLRDMTMMTKYANLDGEEVHYIMNLLMHGVVTLACMANSAEKRTLHQSVLERDADVEENEALEREWQKKLVMLAKKPLTASLIEAFMMMNKHQRTAQLANKDNLLRLMQLQMRLNTSIENGDVESAQRFMQSYLKPIEQASYAA